MPYSFYERKPERVMAIERKPAVPERLNESRYSIKMDESRYSVG
jgi:hypothetical protein